MAKCELLKWYGSKAFQCLSNIPFFIHSEYFIINKKQLTYYTCHYDIKIHALKTTSSRRRITKLFNKLSSIEDKKKKSLKSKKK